jgi:hypothetical protein
MDKLRVSIMMTASALLLPSRSLRSRVQNRESSRQSWANKIPLSVLASSLLHLKARSEIPENLFLLKAFNVACLVGIFILSFVFYIRKVRKTGSDALLFAILVVFNPTLCFNVLIVRAWYPFALVATMVPFVMFLFQGFTNRRFYCAYAISRPFDNSFTGGC